MKKLLLSTALILISIAAFSQKLTLGLRGGLNFANLRSSAEGSSTANTSNELATFSVGAFADIKLASLSLQPAICFTGKGGQANTGDGGAVQFNLHYIQFPVNIVYHLAVSAGDFYLGAGPYLAFGSGGSLTAAGPGGDAYFDASFGGTGDFSGTETGIDGIAGLQFRSGFLVHINYDAGFTNILNSNGPEGDLGTMKTRTLGVSVGFVF